MSAQGPPPRDVDTGATTEEVELAEVLESYLAQLEAGRPADPEGLIAAHPELARPLRACLKVMHLAQGLDESGKLPAGPLPVDPDTFGTVPPSGSSALAALWPGADRPPRVLLPEPPEDDSPIVRTHSDALFDSLGGAAGRYQVLGEIARGGMGIVLKARDTDLGRDLALKVLLDRHRDDQDVIRRFVEEAQIGGQLQHPGIVPVHELGSLADLRPFFAMRLVKGRTLAALLAERPDRAGRDSPAFGRGPAGTRRVAAGRAGRGSPDPAPPATEGLTPAHDDLPRFLSIFEVVCQTMAYAHARRVIHRDLKPANVMAGSFGEVQVMDWGLAKVLPEGGIADEAKAMAKEETAVLTVRSGSAGSGSESQAGSVLGTPAYMAPEQARGDVEQIDERADVFGLGAILCEILTGRPPYVGSTRDEIRDKAARGDQADALDRLAACGADRELIDLARHCLAAQPENRPRNAGDVSRRLTAYLAGVQDRLKAAELARVEAQTRADEAQARARIERSRRRRTVALAASVLITAGLAGGGWAYLTRQRTARQMATTRVVTDALAEAERLRGQAQSAALGELTRWTDALGAARRARDLLAEGEADDSLRGRVTTALVELEREQAAARQRAAEVERDRMLLGQLETIRESRSEHWDPKQTDAEYAAAFRGFGIDLDQLDPTESGKRIAQRSAPVELALYLDDWASQRRKARDKLDDASWRRLLAAAQAADPDPWRVALRDQIGRDDREGLRRLAADQKTLEGLAASTLELFASALNDQGDRDRAEEVLRRAWRQAPGDIWVNYDLGTVRWTGDNRARPEEAARFLSVAVAIRPRSHVAHNSLGVALGDQGKPDEAIAEYRTALGLNPDHFEAHINLGDQLREQGKLDEAIAECREALRLKPDSPEAHSNLGAALNDQGKPEEAIAECREALRLKPDFSNAHNNLGLALFNQGQLSEAIAAYREAVRLKPDHAYAHNNLGSALLKAGKLDESIAEYRTAIRLKPGVTGMHSNLANALYNQRKVSEAVTEWREALRLNPDKPEVHYDLGVVLSDQGKLDEAIAEYRTALRLKPDYAGAHCNLGGALRGQGRFVEALAEFKRGHELGSKNPNWHFPSAEWVRDTERMVELDRKLPAILAGEARPSDALETRGFAQLCYEKKFHGASARFWAEAFQGQPKLAEDMEAQNRYNAACAAASAGSGQGKDDPPLDDAAKTRWRNQAIDWLKADLAAWSKVLESGPPQARPAVLQTLQHWKADTDLAGLRDEAPLAKLPADQQKACRALWAEVEALLAKANAGAGTAK